MTPGRGRCALPGWSGCRTGRRLLYCPALGNFVTPLGLGKKSSQDMSIDCKHWAHFHCKAFIFNYLTSYWTWPGEMFMSIASIHHFSHIPHLELDPKSLDLLQKVLPIIMAVFPQLLTLLARSPWSASLSWQRICAPHLLLALLLTLLLILLPILLLILLPMLDFYLVLLRKMLRQHLYIANITRYCWENEAVSDSSWVSTNS